MLNLKTSLIAIIIVTASLVIFSYESNLLNEINAEEADEETEAYKSANDITIHTVFSFGVAVEESNGFEVFKQESGFDRHNNFPVFELEGVVDSSRTYLYEAADMIHQRGSHDVSHPYAHFEVDVYLQKAGVNMRHFQYTNCMVSDYKVETLFDKEEAWMGKGFVIIDSFEFECSGYMPHNPLYEMMEDAAKKKPIQSEDDLPTGDKYPTIPQ